MGKKKKDPSPKTPKLEDNVASVVSGDGSTAAVESESGSAVDGSKNLAVTPGRTEFRDPDTGKAEDEKADALPAETVSGEAQEKQKMEEVFTATVLEQRTMNLNKMLESASPQTRQQFAEVARNAGNKALKNGASALAIRFYNKAIELDSGNHVLYGNRSAAYYNTRQYELSLQDADRAIQIKPDWWKGYKRKASSLIALTEFDKCIETYNEALKILPDSEELKQGLEEAHVQIKLMKRSQEVMTKLEGVPVFTVMTGEGQPVLMVNPDNPNLQICYFFFSHVDAEGFLEKIKVQEPTVTARVDMVGLDRAYEMAKITNLEDANNGSAVIGCLMPEQKQIEAADKILAEAAGPGRRPRAPFSGIPVFQAKHLTLVQNDARAIPLFFSREDLDAAWDQLKAQKAEIPLDAAIEVGSLGDVLKRLTELDTDSDEVVFIPSKQSLDYVEKQQALEEAAQSEADPAQPIPEQNDQQRPAEVASATPPEAGASTEPGATTG